MIIFTIASHWSLMYHIRLRYTTVSLLGYGLIYVFIYVLMKETALLCNCLVLWSWREILLFKTIWFYVFGVKWVCQDARTFINFVLASVWKWHALFMYSIYGTEEKTTLVEKNLSNILRYLKIKNCVVKTLFIVCLLLLGEWPRHESL